jgi:hypothetical protein
MQQVVIDEVWATPSTLHARVIVFDSEGRWRHKYYPAVALADVPVEALAPLLAWFAEQAPRQMTLYDL